MGHARRAGAYKTFSIASAAGAALLTALLAAPAVAAPGKGAELLASGVKSLEAGKPADAVTTLTSALSSGTLDSAGMAKALYYRGLAHRRQGRPAQAIADLTNAMWIKGGLSEAERTDATAQRAAAYQEAGVAGQGPAKVATAASPPSAPTAPASSPPTTPATGWQTSSAPARADR
ncbi:MAG: hypothetical protein HXY24_15385, partial [Rubrivivax sp.]|nr:hypothetical protein [Rubrivivax sp.]